MARTGPMAKHSPVMRPEVSRPYPVLLGADRKDRVTSQLGPEQTPAFVGWVGCSLWSKLSWRNSRKPPAHGRRSDLKEASEFCQKHSVDPASGRLRRRNETGGPSTVPDSAPKGEITAQPLTVELEFPDEDQRKFRELIDNWTPPETFPLPIQPVGPTLRAIPEGSEEAIEEPYMMQSYDIFVYCFDSPDLNYDDHFSMAIPNPWRLQFWRRGKNEAVALRGLHDHPVISGYILEDHTRPSRSCEEWLKYRYPLQGFHSMDAQFVVTHSVDTTAIWRLDRLWQVAETAALGHKKDPRKLINLMETMENKSRLSECRAELWLKNSEGMYPVRRDKAQAFVATVGEYLPGQRSPEYRPDDCNGGVVLKMDSSGLLILTVARGPEVDVYAILPHTLDVVPVTVDDSFRLDSSLELVFPEVGGSFRGLRARLEQPDSATTSYSGDGAQANKDSPPPSSDRTSSTAPGQKSLGSTPPSSVKDGPPSQPRPKSKAGIGQHQVRTPRGASLHGTNIGRGWTGRGLVHQISSRGTATPASPSRVQVSCVGVRQGLQNDGRPAVGVRTSDKQRPLASQGPRSNSVSTLGVRVSERPSNSPRDTRPSTSTGPTAIRSNGNRPVANLSGGSPTTQTSHASTSKTVHRDVKAATSEGVRLRVDRRGQAVSPKLVESPPQPESVEPVYKASAASATVQTSYVASPQNFCAVPVNQQRVQGLSSWPSVWVPQVIPAVPAVSVQVPISMVSRSSMGRHLLYSKSSFSTVATAYPSASLNRWPVAH
eukprot:s2442_g1.t1